MELDVSSCVLDSSVWVALFLDGDTNHEKAAEIFDSITRRVYVPYVVLSEVATALTYKFSKRQADKFLQFVTDNERFSLIDNRYATDVPAFLKFADRISFADIAIIGTALTMESTLITFDKQMKKLYERVLEHRS